MINRENNNAKLFCIMPAAGKSSRYKKGNKLYDYTLENGNSTVIMNTISSFLSVGIVEKIFVGYDDANRKSRAFKDDFIELSAHPENSDFSKVKFLEGGDARQETVFNILKFISDKYSDTDKIWVLVHDAARPCLNGYEILSFINKTLENNRSSIMAIPVSDTIKKVDKNLIISETVSRENIWVAQTPQMFKFDVLFQSLKYCIDMNINVTDESQALEILGHECSVIKGYSHNIKITHDSDIIHGNCIVNHISNYYFNNESEENND